MQNIVWGAVASLVVAVLGMAAKKLYFDVQRRLVVTVRIWRVHRSQFESGLLNDKFQELQSGDQKWHLLLHLIRTCSYLEIVVANPSKKQIQNVSVAYQGLGDVLWQVEDEVDLKTGGAHFRIPLENIQPEHKRRLNLWTGNNDYNSDGWRKLIVVSADEIDSVRFKFPAPGCLRKKYEPWLMLGIIALIFATFFMSIQLGFLHQ